LFVEMFSSSIPDDAWDDAQPQLSIRLIEVK
jgi:hypothetical protein